MYREKITIEMFNDIKKQFKILYMQKNKIISTREKITDKIYKEKYTELLNKLLSYDLSNIPFEEWKFILIEDIVDNIDFSKTKANIDFKILNIKKRCNFKGCNIRNLQDYYYLNEQSIDEELIKSYPNLFLSNNFNNEFKEKFYNRNLTIEDLISLTDIQIKELEEKDYLKHLIKKQRRTIELYSLEKMINLYKYSLEDYNFLNEIINNDNNKYYDSKNQHYVNLAMELNSEIKKNNDLTKIKSDCYKYLRNNIIYSENFTINQDNYPKDFIDENKDLFLIDVDIPIEVKHRYLNKRLTDGDIIVYYETFNNVPIEYFVSDSNNFGALGKKLGEGNLQKLIKKYYYIFAYLKYESDITKTIITNIKEEGDYEERFTEAIRDFIEQDIHMINTSFKYTNFESLGLKIVETYKNIEDLKTYDYKTIVQDEHQRAAIKTLGVENIVKFDEETNLFSHTSAETWHIRLYNLGKIGNYLLNKNEIKPFSNYDEFKNSFAQLLNEMRKNNSINSYDFIEGEFREKYNYIFMDKNAPIELKNAFYQNNITADLISKNKEFIPYLLNKELLGYIKGYFHINCTQNKHTYFIMNSPKIGLSIIDYLTHKFGNEYTLEILYKYGSLCENIRDFVCDVEDTKEEFEDKLNKYIYEQITKGKKRSYEILKKNNPKFLEQYPDIFINYEDLEIEDEKIKDIIYNRYYTGALDFADVYNHNSLKNTLINKNLTAAFYNSFEYDSALSDFCNKIGNSNFLDLCILYGYYLKKIDYKTLEKCINSNDFEKTKTIIEDYLIRRFYNGVIEYDEKNSPKIIKEKAPDLFLDENAPRDLKEYFYNIESSLNFNFSRISKNPHWLEYLKNKSIETAFFKSTSYKHNEHEGIITYFKMFGQDKALKLGINKPETIDKMIESFQVEKIKTWYDCTGEKFIPDHVVMQNFPIDQIDKFLKSSSIWSKLMKIERYSINEEGRDALLKLAYAFGVFDNDQKGINQLFELINGIPKKIYDEKLLYDINSEFKFRMISLENDTKIKCCHKISRFLEKEGIDYDVEKGIMSSVYEKNENNEFNLKINTQKHRKVTELIRIFIEGHAQLNLLTPEKAHQLFGGFKLTYDKDFKDFLIENLDKIMSNPDYANKIANIQRQFRDIKIANSNRKLTLDLAISYIQQNQYADVGVGNEELSEISSIAGYSQSDFDTLQLIYNFGKQRVFSSIPRIKNQQDKYNYEILRLDDPLALAIGTLTDCCQEIGNVAEMCVEHSMVDKNGRVFVIKDDLGNIISQSWVWRNKNILCFDNIEIPDKVFSRISKQNKDKKEFTNEVYNIYKKAAQELIEIDEQKYKGLLEEGKITTEQYEGLKLSKVTVGLGYNDIAETLKEKSTEDQNPTSPLEFSFPVKLDHSLYTNDSETQYVLEQTEATIPYEDDILLLYHDELKIYNKDNFKEKELLKLMKLEIATKGNDYDLVTDLYDNTENVMSELADNCELDLDKTKVIMNPNFAIIYEEDENAIKIGELFYNTQINNKEQKIDIIDKVLLQLKLALEEITKDKKVDIELLEEKQKVFYKKAMELNDEIDIEKGIRSIKK